MYIYVLTKPYFVQDFAAVEINQKIKGKNLWGLGGETNLCSQDAAFMHQKQNSPTQALYFAGINSELTGLTVLENL